jgi:glucose uptake protein
MVIVESYAVAVVLCVITMLCWGSWANTQKLASKEWRFQLFYWDYCIGVLLLTLIFAFTLGSTGAAGQGFVENVKQADPANLRSALLGGVIFNIANILLVAAIDIAGLAVAFPVGIGLALVLGVARNYLQNHKGDPTLLFLGVAGVAVAIVLNAIAYRKLTAGSGQKTTAKGIILSVLCGGLMGFFYEFVACTMPKSVADWSSTTYGGLLTPYAAMVLFALGLLLSSFVFNVIVMLKPFSGPPVGLLDYFTKGTPRLHVVGIVGGMIWSVGMSLSIIASGKAGPAISYGLGQGATLVAALWGVFIWREFKAAPPGTNKLLALMFVFFVAGLGLIIAAGA